MNIQSAIKEMDKAHKKVQKKLPKSPFRCIEIDVYNHGDATFYFGDDPYFTLEETQRIYEWLGQVLGETK